MPADIRIHQIFYDEETRAMLDPGFIPLDNTSNERPDWYELWPIRRFLRETALDPEAWYGFFSPRFAAKTGLVSSAVRKVIRKVGADADLVLFSNARDQIAYFRNIFEQGEYSHPGLYDAMVSLLHEAGTSLDLRGIVDHSRSGVFGNYVVAKASFWREWLKLADLLVDLVESGRGSARLQEAVSYGGRHDVPLKAFVQERLAALLIHRDGLKARSYEEGAVGPLFARLFIDMPHNRELLQRCDALKLQYARTGDPAALDGYYRARAQILTARPMPPPWR